MTSSRGDTMATVKMFGNTWEVDYKNNLLLHGSRSIHITKKMYEKIEKQLSTK